MKSPLSLSPILCSPFRNGMNLESYIWEHVKDKIKEKSILAVTSKIVSLAEGRLLSKKGISKRALIEQESDHFVCETHHGVCLSIKHGLLIPSAGIDESNSESGDYILYPLDPYSSAQKICDYLKKESSIKELGVILTD